MIVQPETFARAFAAAVDQFAPKIIDVWNGPLPAFTNLMLDEVLPATARRLDLQYQREYWHTDAILFTRFDSEHFGEAAGYAESVAVAVEHENDFKLSHQEINHLSILNTPLKVLIAYPTAGERVYLDLYARILRKADVFSDFATLRKHLVVFGYHDKGRGLAWSFFVYGEKGFSALVV